MSKRFKGYGPPIDSLGRSRDQTWLVTKNAWGANLSAVAQPAGADLFDSLMSEAIRLHRLGWELTERPFFNCEFFVVNESGDRRCVTFHSVHPDLKPTKAQGEYRTDGFHARYPGWSG